MINTYSEFALSIKWDFIEANPIGDASGGYLGGLEWAAKAIEHCLQATCRSEMVKVRQASATDYVSDCNLDLILTDPPYYKSISYADLSDLFYVWQKRLHDTPEFQATLSPKDKEVVQHVHQDKDPKIEKIRYENGMYEAFCKGAQSLDANGRLVIVFAHKEPDAWETLVSGIIRAGFCVTASWPIQTERDVRKRAIANASLSSSVWLVCKKRLEAARPGWDNRVLDEMRQKIHVRLRDYWDAGIRGPDFVWAATGPAMEAYSKHPIVKKANEPGKLMDVAEFIRAVRRLVVDFVVGRVLTGGDETTASGLDDITTYYILHRHDFGMNDAPVGACILYAVSCNLSDSDLANRHEILLRTGGLIAPEEDDDVADAEEEADADAEPEEGTGSVVKLRPWHQRKRKTMGFDAEGHPAPLIDQVHRLMHLWKAGDVIKVDDYLDARGLKRNALFHQLLQALIELAGEGTEERAVLESVSNHLVSRGGVTRDVQRTFLADGAESEDAG